MAACPGTDGDMRYQHLNGHVSPVEEHLIAKLLLGVSDKINTMSVTAEVTRLVRAVGAFRRSDLDLGQCVGLPHSPARDIADQLAREPVTAAYALHLLSHAVRMAHERTPISRSQQVVAVHDRNALSFLGVEFHHAAHQLVMLIMLRPDPPGVIDFVGSVVRHNQGRDVANAIEVLAAELWSLVERGLV